MGEGALKYSFPQRSLQTPQYTPHHTEPITHIQTSCIQVHFSV